MEGSDPPEESPNSHVDESCGDQISRDWDHDYDWLLLDDHSSVPQTSRSSWASSSPQWNALQGLSTQDLTTYVLMAQLLDLKNFMNGPSSLLLPGERGYKAYEEVTPASLAASIRAHPRDASEMDALNYFQVDWSCTNPTNDSAPWIPFPHIRPFHPAPPDRRQSSVPRELDHMPNGELIDGFCELYKQNIDMRLDLGILDQLKYPVLPEKLIRGTLKERKHGACYSEERCSICLEDYVDGEYIGILKCRHKFHQRCINRWILKKNRCPMCNRKLQ